MKIIFAVDKTRFIFIKQFTTELEKLNIKCHIIDDLSIYENSILNNKLRWLNTPKKFRNLIDKIKPDLVFTERTSHFASLVINEKIPLVIFLRGNIWEEIEESEETNITLISKIQSRFKKNIMKKCFENSLMILPICDFLTNIVKKKYPRKNIISLDQGVNVEEWFFTEKKNLYHPCVGLLQNANFWKKSGEMLILKKALKELPNVNFYWAGDGPYRDKILSELQQFENFKWLGSLKYPDEVRDFLSEIDIYALISGLDMAPHTLLESQLMKRPVIATNVGGIPELMINEKTGFLVSKGNPDELIEKIKILLSDEKKRIEFGNEGRKFVEENFQWEKIAKDFLKDLQKKLA